MTEKKPTGEFFACPHCPDWYGWFPSWLAGRLELAGHVCEKHPDKIERADG